MTRSDKVLSALIGFLLVVGVIFQITTSNDVANLEKRVTTIERTIDCSDKPACRAFIRLVVKRLLDEDHPLAPAEPATPQGSGGGSAGGAGTAEPVPQPAPPASPPAATPPDADVPSDGSSNTPDGASNPPSGGENNGVLQPVCDLTPRLCAGVLEPLLPLP